MQLDWKSKTLRGLCLFKCKPRGMETCLHFRGAALNASEVGISRATKDDGPPRTAVAKAIILPCGD